MKLAARALSFGYPGRTVGRDLHLTLRPGEVLCVLGPNGSGKTTLFRTLLGLLAPISGSVLLGDRDISRLRRDEIAREIAYVPQAAASTFDFTVLEVVEMGRTVHRGPFAAPRPRDAEIAYAALDRLGIGTLALRAMGEASGGERQLALIARALATEAATIVLDEPTASLDFGNQLRVLGEISRLKHAGIAVLFCTHDPDHAWRVADRVLLLKKGERLVDGPPPEALTTTNLSRLYDVPPEEFRPRDWSAR